MFDVPLNRLVPEYIKKFEPYIPSKPDPELMKLYNVGHLWRLNNNENPLGPPYGSTKVLERFPPVRTSLSPLTWSGSTMKFVTVISIELSFAIVQ